MSGTAASSNSRPRRPDAGLVDVDSQLGVRAKGASVKLAASRYFIAEFVLVSALVGMLALAAPIER